MLPFALVVAVYLSIYGTGDIENSSDVLLKKKRAKHRTQREKKQREFIRRTKFVKMKKTKPKAHIRFGETTTEHEKSRKFFQAYPVLELQ